MAYKTIFTALTAYDAASPSLALATALADTQDAHLDVLCLGLDPTQNSFYEMGANAVVMHAAIEAAHEKADHLNTAVTAHLQGSGLRYDVINNIAASAGVGRNVAMQARFSDLAVLDLPYGDDTQAVDSLVLEGLLFEAGCPTLIVPPGPSKPNPGTIVIGWNESAEALNAARAALPFLQAAETVHIAIIDPPATGPERSDPGGALAVYLFRHGIRCDIQVLAREGMRVSARLAQHTTETGADMLVMGAYGHSRFREAVLGGATRDTLEHSKVPVLMAH